MLSETSQHFRGFPNSVPVAQRSCSIIHRLRETAGISQPTAKAWLGILEAGFIVFRQPGHRTSIRKRLVKMPKLYFYDTGPVCRLLGIRDPGELWTHPLRGAIFETRVVSEIARQRANRGETGGVSFFRDRNGLEADFVIKSPVGTVIVEAKSSKTASPSLFDSPGRVQRLLSSSVHQCSAFVVSGGDQPRHRGAGHLIPWQDLHNTDWSTSEL